MQEKNEKFFLKRQLYNVKRLVLLHKQQILSQC